MPLLGAEVPLSRDAIRAQASTHRVLKIEGRNAQALHLNFPTPSAAIKLRGRLGFAHLPLNGETWSRRDGPLISRQYLSRTTKLTSSLRRCLFWWYKALGSLPPRTAPCALLPPFGAHSDAQFLGHIACRVLPDHVVTRHSHQPGRLVRLANAAEGGSIIYLSKFAQKSLPFASRMSTTTIPRGRLSSVLIAKRHGLPS